MKKQKIKLICFVLTAISIFSFILIPKIKNYRVGKEVERIEQLLLSSLNSNDYGEAVEYSERARSLIEQLQEQYFKTEAVQKLQRSETTIGEFTLEETLRYCDLIRLGAAGENSLPAFIAFLSSYPDTIEIDDSLGIDFSHRYKIWSLDSLYEMSKEFDFTIEQLQIEKSITRHLQALERKKSLFDDRLRTILQKLLNKMETGEELHVENSRDQSRYSHLQLFHHALSEDNLEKATEYLSLITSPGSKNSAHYYMFMYLLRTKGYEEARRYENSFNNYSYRARAASATALYFADKDSATARKYLKKAERMWPKISETMRLFVDGIKSDIAVVYAHLGDMDSAMFYAKQAEGKEGERLAYSLIGIAKKMLKDDSPQVVDIFLQENLKHKSFHFYVYLQIARHLFEESEREAAVYFTSRALEGSEYHRFPTYRLMEFVDIMRLTLENDIELRNEDKEILRKMILDYHSPGKGLSFGR